MSITNSKIFIKRKCGLFFFKSESALIMALTVIISVPASYDVSRAAYKKALP
jgi:hypothetical protein